MSTYRPVPGTAQAMRPYDYVVVMRPDSQLEITDYTVHAHNADDASAALARLLGDDECIVAMIECPSKSKGGAA